MLKRVGMFSVVCFTKIVIRDMVVALFHEGRIGKIAKGDFLNCPSQKVLPPTIYEFITMWYLSFKYISNEGVSLITFKQIY